MKKSFLWGMTFFCLWWSIAYADMTLAVIAPKSGYYAKAGAELFEGARLAVKELNDNGGVNGQRLDLLTIDDRCNDRLAISTAEMLTLLKSKKIGLVVGPYCSNRIGEIADIYEKAKIFQIVPTTEAYSFRGVDRKGQILLLGTKTEMSKDFFKFYNNNFAGLSVGFVYDGRAETGYTDVAKTLYDEFRHHGKANLLKFYMLNAEVSDVSDVARQTVKDKVHIVFVLGEPEEIVDFINAVKRKDKNMIVFTGKKLLPVDIEGDMGFAAEGIYALDLPGLKDSLMFTESLVDLRLLGIEPEGLEVYSYVAIKLWGDLVKSVRSFDYNKLSRTANSSVLRQKWGEFLMHSGSISAAKYIIEEYRDGTFKQVY